MIYESSLFHHGIKGQKWGVQHGPPYPLSNGAGSISRGGRDAVNTMRNQKKRSAARTAQKEASSMSDTDLRNAVNRMNLEQQYTNLKSNRVSTKGMDYAHDILSVAGSVAVAAGGAATLLWAIKQKG